MDIVTLDFETYYSTDYSLSKRDMTTQKYVNDPRFEVIGVGTKLNNEECKWFSGTAREIKEYLLEFNWANATLLAHNALFDATILDWRFGIIPAKILDTLSMARALHGVEVSGSLAALAKRYDVGIKGNEVLLAKGKRRVHFTPEELAQYGGYCINDVFLTYYIFYIMAVHFNWKELALIDMTIKMHTQPQFHLDVPFLTQHLTQTQQAKHLLLEQCTADKDSIMSNLKLASVLQSMGVAPPMKPKKPTKKTPNPSGDTYAFAKTDEAFLALLEHEDVRVQAIVAARLKLKSTLEETRTERFIQIANDFGGLLPIPLKYYGALTGRWSGADKVNLQNLPRGSAIKKAITAPLGEKIIGADLSNIELRVGLFFAGEMEAVTALGAGMDLYKDFAAKVFDVPYEDVDAEQRFIGKTSQLSLIYGVGAIKLRSAIKQQSGKDIGEHLASNIVMLYRDEYMKVKRSWWECKRVLMAIKENTAIEFGLGPLKLAVHGYKGIQLPSGLYMQYPDLEVKTVDDREQWSYYTRQGRTYIYPAKVFQNVIQALARCVMGEAMIEINKRIPVALTVHDSCYGLAPEEEADTALKFFISSLRKAPAWLPGIPLDAEGGYGDNLSFKMSKVDV